eukprot:IDg7547t1
MVSFQYIPISLVLVWIVHTQMVRSESEEVLAGLKLQKDVSQHARIDLDQRVLERGDFMSGRVYGMGNHSMKSDGSLRSIR